MIPENLEATLVLVRHGESIYIAEDRFQGQADSSLSPLGLQQAALAGARLARPHRSPALPIPLRPPVEIVHSPLLRTAETASAIAAAIVEAGGGPSMRPEAGLLEIAQGAWEGLPRQEVASRYGAELAAWRRDPTHNQAPGGERLVDAQPRIRAALLGVLSRLDEGAASAGPIRTSHASPVAGYPGPSAPDAPWSIVVGHDGAFKVLLLTLFGLPLERFWSFPFAVAGITVIELRGGQPVLRLHASTEHLAPLLEERSQAETESRDRLGAL